MTFIQIKKDTTVVPLGTDVRTAPGDVNPGHMILAPLSTNFMAPLSTCSNGKKNGTAKHHTLTKFNFMIV